MSKEERKKNEYIPIVYTPDDNYIPLALTSMVSVAENTEANIDFIIIYSKLSEKSINYLNDIKKYSNCKITYKQIDEKIFIEAGALA